MPESQTADLAFMRELDERIVLNLICQEGPMTPAELARRSNLSRPTGSRIISALLVRPILLQFNGQPGCLSGVTFTPTLMVLLTNLAATIRSCIRRPIAAAAGPDVCIPQIADLTTMICEAGVPVERLLGIGIGVPGPLPSSVVF